MRFFNRFFFLKALVVNFAHWYNFEPDVVALNGGIPFIYSKSNRLGREIGSNLQKPKIRNSSLQHITVREEKNKF